MEIPVAAKPVAAKPAAQKPAASPTTAPPTAAPPTTAPPAAAPPSEVETLRSLLSQYEARLKQVEARPVAPVPAAGEVDALRARVGDLEARLKKSEERAPATTTAPAAVPPGFGSILGLPVYTTTLRPDSGFVLDPVGVVVSGYIQAQYLSSELSEDQLAQGGAPLNKDRFMIRRARLRVDGSWKWARLSLELDGNTVAGTYAGIHRAEASLLWRNPSPGTVPYAMLTAGLQEIPFGYELPEGVRRRLFMERTQGSQALFPGDSDLGARLSGGVAFVRYAAAVMNGTPVIDRPGATNLALTQEKDVLGRVGIDTGTAARRWNISGGVSFLVGTGLHAGSDATVGGVQWRDANENGVVDQGELVGVPAQAATPSQTFTRWAVGGDLQVKFRTPLGWTQIYGEATLAENLDRAYQPSDPVVTGYNLRQLAGYAAITQEVLRYGVIGFRWDYYNPNADFLDNRRGQLIPSDASIQTLSPVAGVTVIDHLRLLFQYDAIFDHLARDTTGVPVDLKNNQWTLRLQGDL